jgi:DNA-binding transcriptional LysR family regulator
VELRHLRAFVAVAEELHFGRAAERLYVVQPALSKRIASLEAELGVRLFERSRRRVALTEAGAALLEDARRLVDQADGLAARAREVGRGEAGLLRLGFIAPALYALVPQVLRRCRDELPGVRVLLEEVHNREAVEGVRSGRFHVAFVRLPAAPDDGVVVEAVREDPVVVAVPDDHPLAARREVALADLADVAMIMIPRSHEPELFDHYVALCRSAGFSPRVAHEVDRTHVGVGLVAGGLGVCFVPASAQRVEHPGVVYRPLRAPGAAVTLGVARRAGAPAPVVERLLALQPWAPP